MVALINEYLLELSFDILDYSFRMIGRNNLILFTVKKDYRNVESYLFIKVYIERIVSLTDRILEDSIKCFIHVSQSDFNYKIWD